MKYILSCKIILYNKLKHFVEETTFFSFEITLDCKVMTVALFQYSVKEFSSSFKNNFGFCRINITYLKEKRLWFSTYSFIICHLVTSNNQSAG